jgi:hypothetical protein
MSCASRSGLHRLRLSHGEFFAAGGHPSLAGNQKKAGWEPAFFALRGQLYAADAICMTPSCVYHGSVRWLIKSS